MTSRGCDFAARRGAGTMIRVTLVLVADDNRELRELLKLILQRAGHDVVLAEDGEEAFVQVMKRRPAVVLCDYAMPRLDGPGFIRMLRSYPDTEIATTPVIGFSAYDGAVEAFMAAGADEVIGKPCHLAEIVFVVNKYARRKAEAPGA